MALVRVRFAPSPTGELHIGGARTALFNYLFARAHGGTFILRIDDTDQDRSRPEYVEALLDAMRWLNLHWDEGPYYQSQRLDQYLREAERLLDTGKAYRCYCSPARLEEERLAARRQGKPYIYPRHCRSLTQKQEERCRAGGSQPVIRLRVPEDGTTVVQDEIRGKVSFDNQTMDDYIIIKSNGLPTYNFASIVDDQDMAITHVIRAEEHLSNTPRQQLCAEALGYRLPRFAHVPMILAPDRSKLSKRHGATAVEEFRDQGYLPEALINYMTLLGWSPGAEEIVSLAETVNRFSLDRVNNTAAIYDTAKLTWLNGHYLRAGNIERVAGLAVPFFIAEGLLPGEPAGEQREQFLRVIEAVRERARTLRDLALAADYFYRDELSYEPAGVEKLFQDLSAAGLLRAAAEKIAALSSYTPSGLREAYQSLGAELNVSQGRLIPPTRLALSGRTGGPDLFEMMAILGKEKSVNRLRKAALYIESCCN